MTDLATTEIISWLSANVREIICVSEHNRWQYVMDNNTREYMNLIITQIIEKLYT